MKSTRIIWGFISLLVLITAAISFGIFPSRGQERLSAKDTSGTPKPIPPDTRDLTKYGSIHYENPVSAVPGDERFLTNKRYDNLGWVFTSVANNPRAAAVGRITHDPIAQSLPAQESSLVLVGNVVSAKAFLSNDRRGVYSEFRIVPEEILKNGDAVSEKELRAHREGGVVIYPNGQRIIYQSSTLALPMVGRRYLFFLTKNGDSSDYEILAAYDLQGEKVFRLEQVSEKGEEVKDSKERFLDLVRTKVAENR